MLNTVDHSIMRVLGLDPSLTNLGWAVYDTEQPNLSVKGLISTSSSTLYIQRYMDIRHRLGIVIDDIKPDRVGIEFPVFGSDYSEGMYGLFLFCSEALHTRKLDTVFWSPLQIKAHAREGLGRPAGWQMMKPDMVEAAKTVTGGRWNHNEADAWSCARLASRFWLFMDGVLTAEDLTVVEAKYFTAINRPQKGEHAGKEFKVGVSYREGERFFRWSQAE